MNHKVELFVEHWYDEGYVFATKQEAEEYGKSLRAYPYRVSPTEDPVNYQFSQGHLKPYKVFLRATSWEEYMLSGGCGMPIPWGATAFVHSSKNSS